MKNNESEHVSAAKVGTYGVIAAALITALSAIIVAVITSSHNQKQNGSNANLSFISNENKNNANASVANGNAQIHPVNNNKNSPFPLQSGNNNENLPPPPPPVPPPYKVDWGVFEKYFTVSDRRIEGPDMAQILVFVVQAKSSYSTFKQAPIFKAEFLDGEGILIGPVVSTIVDYNPHHINWDTQTRSKVSISLPTGENRFKLRLIRFSRIT
jgi:hypothetical protein